MPRYLEQQRTPLYADVPMIIPEINAEHAKIIPAQRKRLGTKKGFIAVKSNCSLQSYVPAVAPLMDLGVSKVLACTYQAISGAGKTFERWPEMVDNIIPYIGGEEEKSEQEPMKIWGRVEGDKIVNAQSPLITSQCIRVPVSDGHTAAVFVELDKKASMEEIIKSGKATGEGRRSWTFRARRSSSSIISGRTTGRRLNRSATLKTVWLFPSGVCARIRSIR